MRSRISVVALFSVTTLILGVFSATLPALISVAATGAVSAVSQTVVSDGTAPFDASSGAGADISASNGIIRTHDTFVVEWTYVVTSSGDLTFTETLANAFWDSSSAGSCTQGASAISADKKSITCTLPNLSVGSGSYRLVAVADGNAPNASLVTGSVSVGAAQSSPIALTVSATPRMNISTMDLFPAVANGPGLLSSVTGYYFDVPVAMWAAVNGTFNGSAGVRGLESLASSISFNAEPNNAQALLMSCSAGPAGGTRPSYPNASGGNGASVQNAVRNAGTWSCSQSAAGAPVSVTVAGADSSLNSYPTKSANDSAITSNRAYFADGFIRLWVPKTATTANSATSFSTKITQFDPTSVSGESNYLTSFATNQPDPGSCVAGTYANCSTVTVNRIPQAVRPDVRMQSATLGALPGSSVAWDGLGQVTAGTKYYASLLSSVPISNESMSDVTLCLKWNPAQGVIDTSKSILVSANGLAATIEYGSTQYGSLASYQSADCGRPGSGTPWHTSVSAAGGASAVTAVRVTFNGALATGATMQVDIPQIANSGLTPGQTIGYFGTLSSVETAALPSTYDPSAGTGLSGSRVTHLEARTGVAIAWDASTSSVPAAREITVAPQLIAGQTARDTRVRVTLPSACFEYVAGSASISPSSITPANVGADGIACSSDDVSPAVLEFAFGDISSSPAPITLRTNIAPGISVPSNQTVTATIVTPSDPSSSSVHSATATLAVSAVAGFSLAKTADTGRVSEGVAFNYVINWRNGSANQSGAVKIVDVLPFAGDSRGSSGFSHLALNSVSLPVGASVQYSSLDSATALALADTYPDGENSAFAWTSSQPTVVNAIRIVIGNLPTMTSGQAQINVTATGVQAGGRLKNDLYGVASFASAPIRAAVPLEIQTLGTASLSVTKTANLSEVTAAGQVLNYTIRVTNTGQEALSSISVTDHGFTGTGSAPTVSCPSMVLSAGASMECHTSSYSTLQGDLDTLNTISNRATATGTPPAGSNVEATDRAETPVRASSGLILTQIPSPNSLAQVGSIVSYTFTASNTGTRTLTNLTINGGNFNGSGSVSAINCASSSIAPGSSVTCTATYAVTQHDLDTLSSLIHPATSTAVDSAQNAVNSNSTQTTVPLSREPALTLSKSAAVASFGSVGASVPFVFLVTNTGNVTLTDVGIEETAFSGTGTLGSVVCSAAGVAPGETVTCSASYTATQADYNAGAIMNSAKAHARFNTTAIASPVSHVTVPAAGIAPGITISTTSDLDFVDFTDDVINYSIVVTNTGNVSLSNVLPAIPSGGFTGTGSLSSSAISCPYSTLNPLASMTCTLRYVVTQSDIDSLVRIDLNTTVTANAGATAVTGSATRVRVDVLPVAHLDVSASPSMSASTRAGDAIVFTLRLVNDGARTLSNVSARVDLAHFNGTGSLGMVNCPASLSLAPGQAGNCQVTYVVTQQDIDGLDSLLLTADASGDFGGQTYDTSVIRESNDTAEVQIAPLESLSMVKTSSLPILNAAGDQIGYQFQIANLGTRTLYNVSIIESSFTGSSELGQLSCPNTLSVLSPGASAQCSVQYTAVANDMKKSNIQNTAIAVADLAQSTNAQSIRSLASTAILPVKTAESFNSDPKKSTLTLTGATALTQLLVAGLALSVGGVSFGASHVRRRA